LWNVACSMDIVKKGIQSWLRKLEQEELLGKILLNSVSERNRMGGLDCFC